MKIIDLLNKIANDEEVPKKIKYNNKIYFAKGNAIEGFVDYCSDEDEWCFNHYVRYENLNKEVEFLEEKKIPEKMMMCTSGIMSYEAVEHIATELKDKINEILDYLESKGE